MKKHILLISTFILSFILLVGNVNAEDETAQKLTCIYPEGTSQDYVIMTQDARGKRTYWSRKVGESEQELVSTEVTKEILFIKGTNSNLSCTVTNILGGTTAKKATDSTFERCPEPTEGFKECPKCLDFKSKTATYRDYSNSKKKKCDAGHVALKEEKKDVITTQDDIDSQKILPADTVNKNDLKEYNQCKYGNSGSKIFYISSDQKKMYSNIISSKKEVYLTETFGFTKSEFLEEYNKNNKCPGIIYSSCENDPNGLNNECEWLIDAPKKTANVDVKRFFIHADVNTNDDPDNPTITIYNCEDLFGEETIKEIKKIMGIIKIVVPILLIIFGITDFFRATFSDNEDNMKKDRDRFIKRIIAAIIVFLVPTFVSLVLNLANSVWSDTISTDTCIESTNK